MKFTIKQAGLTAMALTVSVVSFAWNSPTEAQSNTSTVMDNQQNEQIQIKKLRVTNTITLQVTLNKPLPEADGPFDVAKQQLTFDNGLQLTNVPRLMSGSKSTYIIPTSVQKPGVTYTLKYRGQELGEFRGANDKIELSRVKQVTDDTFELISKQSHGVVDYGYIIEAYRKGRGDDAFALDKHNRYKGKTFDIIPSMQGRSVMITPENGQPIEAKYVPFTQSTDSRQAPKFRLPAGMKLQKGERYTVTSDWADLDRDQFQARDLRPLTITDVALNQDGKLQVSLKKDPRDELFSGRSITLKSQDGREIKATYVFQSRKGKMGTFAIESGQLTAGTYQVQPVGDWAEANNVQLIVR